MAYRFLFILLLSLPLLGFAQPKTLTLDDCEKMFQQSNLLLIAERYNIEISKAQLIQAKIWEQPYLSGEIIAFNPETKVPLDVSSNGQKTLAIEQLIYLGGKKRNEIEFAKNNIKLAELQFEQVVRTLKLQVKSSFYSIYFEKVKESTLLSQIGYLDTLVKSYNFQAVRGNLPYKDVVRLQSLSLNLRNDIAEIQEKIRLEQSKLALLTGITDEIIPVIEDKEVDIFTKPMPFTLEELTDKAMTNNPEYKSTLLVIESNELYMKWQKSLSTPDLTLGASYDQKGSAYLNQMNVTFGIPLPLWNKNKGNIKIAQANLEQSRSHKDYKLLEIKSEILKSWRNWENRKQQYLAVNSSNVQIFEEVYRGILQNFRKNNISLFEFTDFMESYNQSILSLSESKKQLILSGLELNYLVYDNLF